MKPSTLDNVVLEQFLNVTVPLQVTVTGSDAVTRTLEIPPLPPEQLGDQQFCREIGIRYPYIGGSMAKGISSVAMAEELGKAGMLGFFGAAGLPYQTVEAAVAQ